MAANPACGYVLRSQPGRCGIRGFAQFQFVTFHAFEISTPLQRAAGNIPAPLDSAIIISSIGSPETDRMAAYILAQTPTPDQEAETGPDAVQSKAQIMDYVKGSFVALHRAMAAINDGNMLETMAAFPSPQQKTRLQLAEDVVAHSFNHYGQMVEYLRMNGIVPPASRR